MVLHCLFVPDMIICPEETNKSHAVFPLSLHFVSFPIMARVALAIKDYNARRPQLPAWEQGVPYCPSHPLP